MYANSFLIMVNDLTLSRKDVELSLFADDSAIYKSGPNLKKLIADIQTTLNDIQEWCDGWGFKITKSCGVIFTNK